MLTQPPLKTFILSTPDPNATTLEFLKQPQNTLAQTLKIDRTTHSAPHLTLCTPTGHALGHLKLHSATSSKLTYSVGAPSSRSWTDVSCQEGPVHGFQAPAVGGAFYSWHYKSDDASAVNWGGGVGGSDDGGDLYELFVRGRKEPVMGYAPVNFGGHVKGVLRLYCELEDGVKIACVVVLTGVLEKMFRLENMAVKRSRGSGYRGHHHNGAMQAGQAAGMMGSMGGGGGGGAGAGGC